MKPIALPPPAVALAVLAACSPAPEPAPQPPLVQRDAGQRAGTARRRPADGPRDAAPPRRGGGAFGIGIRPTGSTATGITP